MWKLDTKQRKKMIRIVFTDSDQILVGDEYFHVYETGVLLAIVRMLCYAIFQPLSRPFQPESRS
jgi:hypothetical protein